MAEPVGRVTPITDFQTWLSLYNQWISEGKPAFIVRRSGGDTWVRIQHTSGSDVFDPVNQETWRGSTGFPH